MRRRRGNRNSVMERKAVVSPQRARVAENLAAGQRFLESLLAHMPVVVYRLDRRLRHVFIGGAVQWMSRLKPAQFIGKTGRELGFPRELCDRFEAVCREVLVTGKPGHLEFQFDQTWIFHRMIPEHSADGSIETILCLAENITDRKSMEAEHARYRKRLIGLVEKRARELQRAYEQARIAERMSSIGTLAAGLGHDMNNVLLPVRAHLEAASSLALVPEVRRHIDSVQTSLAYLQHLADGLHFLALDPEEEVCEPTTTDLSVWWSQAGPLLSKSVPKYVNVEVSLPAGLPAVAMSSHGLTQVVLNLVVNAGEAIPPNRKRQHGLVRIWAELADDGEGGGGRVRLGITDNGRGMPLEVQRSAFEMFFTTKPRGLGTGLGLSMVARVVGRARGSIHIESKPGKGTTVSVLLPKAAWTVRAANALSGAVSLKNGRAADLVAQILESSGVRVLSGEETAKSDIWVLDARKGALADATAWRTRHPDGVLVLFGAANGPSAQRWSSLRPIQIESGDDLEGIRTALGRAIAGF